MYDSFCGLVFFYIEARVFDEFVACRENAIRLADKMKKITVADIIESMKVSVVPVAVKDGQVCSIYKLMMKLYKPKHYPKYTDITREDWEETLRVGFVRKLEDAIQSHIVLCEKISGITNFQGKSGVENDQSNDSESNRNGQTDDDNDGDDTEDADDLGYDAQKSKQQAMDEVDYEDGPEEETREISEGGKNDEDGKDDEDEKGDGDDEDEKGDGDDSDIEVKGEDSDTELDGNDKNVTLDANKSQGLEETSKSEMSKSEPEMKENDRRVYVKSGGMRFEIHFKFTTEPHILLGQVLTTANNFLFSSEIFK